MKNFIEVTLPNECPYIIPINSIVRIASVDNVAQIETSCETVTLAESYDEFKKRLSECLIPMKTPSTKPLDKKRLTSKVY